MALATGTSGKRSLTNSHGKEGRLAATGKRLTDRLTVPSSHAGLCRKHRVSFYQHQPPARLRMPALQEEAAKCLGGTPNSSARRTQASPRTLCISDITATIVVAVLGAMSPAPGLWLAASRLHFNRTPSQSPARWRRQDCASFVAAAGAQATHSPAAPPSATHLHMISWVSSTRHISGFLSWPS